MAMNDNHPTDDEILTALQRRMSSVEPLIPQPPAWRWKAEPGRAALSDTRYVRGRLGFGGFAPLVLIVALLVLAVGYGLGSRSTPATGATSPTPEGTVFIYRLTPPAGQVATQADLDQTIAVIRARLTAAGVADPVVTNLPPDEIWVAIHGAVDTEAVRALIAATGQLEFVPLDRTTYGYVDGTSGYLPGTDPVPASGSKLSDLKGSAPEPLFAASQIYAGSVKAALDPVNNGWAVTLTLKPDGAAALSRWSSGNVGSYLLIALDGVVLSVPYIQSPVTGGVVEIAAMDEASAKRIASELACGSLPYPIVEVGTPQTVGGATPVPGTSATPIGSAPAAPTDPAAPTAPLETANPSPAAIESGSPR
jgi:hypothetical protein